MSSSQATVSRFYRRGIGSWQANESTTVNPRPEPPVNSPSAKSIESRDHKSQPTPNRKTPRRQAPAPPKIDPISELSSWLAVGLPRDQVKSMVRSLARFGKEGQFMIRDKQSEPGVFLLVIKNGSRSVVSFYIRPFRGPDGWARFRLDGAPASHCFNTMSELVAFYADRHTSALKCQLTMSDADLVHLPDNVGATIPRSPFPSVAKTPSARHARNRVIVKPEDEFEGFGTPDKSPKSKTPIRTIVIDSPFFPSDGNRIAVDSISPIDTSSPVDEEYNGFGLSPVPYLPAVSPLRAHTALDKSSQRSPLAALGNTNGNGTQQGNTIKSRIEFLKDGLGNETPNRKLPLVWWGGE